MSDMMLGLHPVFGCENPHRNGDVIFIHGLAGHAWGTWHPQDRRNRQDSDFWLAWLKEDLIPMGIDAGIWSFGYEAARFHPASNLLNFLEVRDIGTRPIIFITHSMGGLLLKQMLRTAKNFQRQAIINQTKGIVFLSTPHTNSHLTKFIDNIRIFTQSSVNFEAIAAHVPELHSLNQWYQQNFESLAIETQVFYETQPTSGILIVDEYSSNPEIRGVRPVGIPKDYHQIAKPSSKEDLVYLSVKKLIEKHLNPSVKLLTSKIFVLQRLTTANPHSPL